MWFIILAIAVILLLLAATGYIFSDKVIHIAVRTRKDTFESETKSFGLDPLFLEKHPHEDIRIKSPFGYELDGRYFPCPATGRAVVIGHGVTYTSMGSLRYVEMFQKQGYHIFIYDQRRHGLSGGDNTTYGYYEKFDMLACAEWVRNRLGAETQIGLFGISMGAATALQAAVLDERIAFVIADCAYSDLREQLAYRLKEDYRYLPEWPLLPLVSAVCRIRTGMRMKEISPIREVARLKMPVLFIHGQADRFIPKEMTLAMFDLKKGYKKLYLAPEAEHASSHFRNPEEYERQVSDFLQEWENRRQPELPSDIGNHTAESPNV